MSQGLEPPENVAGGIKDKNSEQQTQIVWVDSEDVYKPIAKSTTEFRSDRGIIKDKVSRVYIKADALNNLRTHLKSNLKVEQGGILLGNAYEDSFLGIYVEITAAVAAPATIGTGAHLEFTSASWQGIMDYARSRHPQENIVGWYHSHPNIGVFMSGVDMNTQQAFFYHPWCLSIVCDPVRDKIGYFLGEKAEPVTPVIFEQDGQHSQQDNASVAEPEGLLDRIATPEADNGDVSQPEVLSAPIPTPEPGSIAIPNPQKTKTSRREIGVPTLLITLVPICVVVIIVVIINFKNLFPNISITQSNPKFGSTTISKMASPFKEHIKTMSAQDFADPKKRQSLIRYPIVKVWEKNCEGDEITLLVLSKEGSETATEVQLEGELITTTKDIEVVNELKTTEASLIGYGSRKKLSIPLNIKAGQSVVVPMFCSRLSKQSVYPNFSKGTKLEKVVQGIVYMPRKISYKDSNKIQKEVKIQEQINN